MPEKTKQVQAARDDRQIRWFCGVCGKSADVREPDRDTLTVCLEIADRHRAVSPKCGVPVEQLRTFRGNAPSMKIRTRLVMTGQDYVLEELRRRTRP